MKTLTVKLKQHTPLIHFQHDQYGATLRASEVKPKLDRFILSKLTSEEKTLGRSKGWIKSKNGKDWLDYKMKISDNPDNIISIKMNEKREYKEWNEKKDKQKGWRIEVVDYGEIRSSKPESKTRLVIKDENGKKYYAKWRKTDSKIIYDLDTYPCFFANMGCDINDPLEYRKVSFAEEPFDMVIITKHSELFDYLSDINKKILSSFFLNTNFGTRQSKGFGSFYIDESEELYERPHSDYYFNLPIAEDYYYEEFYSLFEIIELFTKTLRAGINDKRGSNTAFYFKSLAFMYCKDILMSEWDKKKVKTEFYFDESDRRKDSLQKQRKEHKDDEDHDILYFDSEDGYDIRDLLGFSTNEEWQSYSDSIEKKVAIIRENNPKFPRNEDNLPVDRMRSPLLVKPFCLIDDDNNVSYDIYLLFQDEEVGMEDFKRQQKICFYSKREKNDKGLQKRIMLKIPQSFSMLDYFDYIFNTLQLNISEHIEEKYHQHEYYRLLQDIYGQLRNNYKKI